MIEYQCTIDKSKLTISQELVVESIVLYGEDGAREAIHKMVDGWIDGRIKEYSK